MRGTLLYSKTSQFSVSILAPSISCTSKLIAVRGTGGKHTLRTEELSRDVQGLASHNDNFLTVEQLLSHSAGQPTKKMTLAIDRDL
jgi:hypothetical protein